jgi:competence protein ComEC
LIYFLAFLFGVVVFPLLKFFPYTGLIICASTAFYLLRGKRYLVLALVIAGLLYPALRHGPPEELPFSGGYVTMDGHFSEPPSILKGGYAQEFEVPGGWRLDVLSGREFETGREYELRLRVMSPAERLNPGAYAGDQYALLEDVRKAGDIHESLPVMFNRLRDRLNGAIRERFDPETASLIMAVTTGHRSGMNYGLKEAFRESGLAHLLSISGTHFGLMFLLLFGIFRTAIKHLPERALERLTLYLTPSQAAAVLCAPFLLLYLGISGGRIPTVRSFIMISLFLAGLLMGRKGRWLNYLVLAAVVLVLQDPEVIASLSFQLSFLAVLFIGFFLGGKPVNAEEEEETDEAPARMSAILRYPLKSLVITLAATVGVAPLVAYYFHYFSVVSPLANLVVTPLVCMVLVPLSVTGSFAYLITGSFPLQSVTGWVAGAAISMVKASAALPHSSVPVPPFPLAVLVFYYAGFILYFVYRDRRLLAVPVIAVLVPLTVTAFSTRTLSVNLLDAGRGDASVLELPDGKAIAVDAGTRGKEVRRYLRHRGIQGLDALALTHADRYHTGGAAVLAEQVGVRQIWDNGRLEYPPDFPGDVPRRTLGRGDVIEGEGYSIRVLHPYRGYRPRSGGKGSYYNDSSLVMKVEGRGGSVLFIGDIGSGAMKDLIPLGERLRSDVLKLSDNGKWDDVHAAFMEAVSPAVVVARGKPGGGLEENLHGAKLYYSGVDGAVRIEMSAGGPAVKTYDELRLKETRSPAGEVANLGRLFRSW